MNETAQLNFALLDALHSFDPYGAGSGFYETEMADAIYAVHQLNDAAALAMEIQKIYEYSFDAPLPGGMPLTLSKQLLEIKKHAACSL